MRKNGRRRNTWIRWSQGVSTGDELSTHTCKLTHTHTQRERGGGGGRKREGWSGRDRGAEGWEKQKERLDTKKAVNRCPSQKRWMIVMIKRSGAEIPSIQWEKNSGFAALS